MSDLPSKDSESFLSTNRFHDFFPGHIYDQWSYTPTTFQWWIEGRLNWRRKWRTICIWEDDEFMPKRVSSIRTKNDGSAFNFLHHVCQILVSTFFDFVGFLVHFTRSLHWYFFSTTLNSNNRDLSTCCGVVQSKHILMKTNRLKHFYVYFFILNIGMTEDFALLMQRTFTSHHST